MSSGLFKKIGELISVTSFSNGWAGISPIGVKYLIDADGIVHIQGGCQGGTTNTTAFILPDGYRSTEGTHNFITLANNVNAIASVNTAGEVKLFTSNVNHYLNTVSFKVTV